MRFWNRQNELPWARIVGHRGMMAKVHKGILGLMNVVFYIMIKVIVTGIHLCQYKVHFKEREIMSAIEKLELIL